MTLRKPCQRCGQTKPLSEYHHNSTKADHHNGICKSCQAAVNEENNKGKKAGASSEK